MAFFRERPWVSGISLLVGILLIACGSGWWFLRPPGRLWDAGRAVDIIAFSPDGHLLASVETTSGKKDHPEIVLRHVPDGQVVTTLKGHYLDIFTLAFSPDGTRLAAAGLDWTIRIWTVADGRLITKMTDRTNNSDVYALAWRPDGRQITTVSRDGSARWWQVEDRTLLRTVQVVADFDGSVAVNPRRELVAYTAVGGPAGIWRAADAQLMTPIAGVFGKPTFSEDGHMVAGTSCQHGYVLCIWNADTGQITAVFNGHTDTIVTSVRVKQASSAEVCPTAKKVSWADGNKQSIRRQG